MAFCHFVTEQEAKKRKLEEDKERKKNERMMLIAYQNMAAGAVSYLKGHPRTGPVIISLAGAGVLGKIVLYFYNRHCRNKKIRDRQEQSRGLINAVAESVSKVTDSESDEIVNKSFQELKAALRNGQLTAVEVLMAFQRKALRVTKDINCVTEPIKEAEELARNLDASPGFKGLLHGIPVSIKESTSIAGYDRTGGMEVHIGDIACEDAVVIQVLKDHGAIPFMRTNIPQTMLSYDCTNPLYGTTFNPLDWSRTPGGSSTGEGALIGGGGSVIGIGSDIGGSLRVPADFCGIFTLKPTWDRVSRRGLLTHSSGNLTVRPVIGPMARDFDSLLHLTQAIMSPNMYELDPLLPPLPFDNKEYEKTTPLRIGFYTYDGTFQCQPPNVRAVMEAKAALEAMGHEVVPFDFPTMMGEGFQGIKRFVHLLAADRLAKLRKLMANDKAVPAISTNLKLGQLPVWLCKAAEFIIGFKDQMLASMFGAAVGFRSVEEYIDKVEDLENFRLRFLDAWLDMALDAVICPVFPSPAPTREIVKMVTPAGVYCWLYNAVNYPAGVVPVTKVTKEDLDKTFDPTHFQPRNVFEKLLLKSTKGSEGHSIGVQCVALPFKEEMCLRVMRDLAQALEKRN
ncbi:fatty-acid amide hydrolase 1-like [Elysia marginata]|uniref:fatty acid amide hydrolase n=1 Tax=Elysia marginata TaxID=1093978 RepID=A0AAV4FLS0_9GAST|nr:fatty-acid amide hydrolase 1-like [Elysia marginata]